MLNKKCTQDFRFPTMRKPYQRPMALKQEKGQTRNLAKAFGHGTVKRVKPKNGAKAT